MNRLWEIILFLVQFDACFQGVIQGLLNRNPQKVTVFEKILRNMVVSMYIPFRPNHDVRTCDITPTSVLCTNTFHWFHGFPEVFSVGDGL